MFNIKKKYQSRYALKVLTFIISILQEFEVHLFKGAWLAPLFNPSLYQTHLREAACGVSIRGGSLYDNNVTH
jgi:hypothetical protein